MTRLGDFLKLSVTNFLLKVAKMLGGNLLAFFKEITFKYLKLQWIHFGQLLAMNQFKKLCFVTSFTVPKVVGPPTKSNAQSVYHKCLWTDTYFVR